MKKKIAVIGAGPMGLAVAYQLALDGFQPEVFEADDRIGGTSAMFDFNGITIERYYHYYCTPDQELIKIIDDLGLKEKLIWVQTKMGYWFMDRLQPWGNPLTLLSFKGLSLPAKIRYGLHVFLSTYRKDWRKLDQIESSMWLKKWIGNEAFEKLWRPLLDYKFHNYATSLSAAWFWSRIRRIGLSRYDLFREKLGYLEGGSETLLNAMHQAILHHGGLIHLNTPVSKVILENAEVKGIQVKGKTEAFDIVISTAPLAIIPKMIPDLPTHILDAYKAIRYIGVVCVLAKLKKPLSKYFWLNINDQDMDIPGLVEFSNIRPLPDQVVYVPYYLPHDHPAFMEPDEYFQEKIKGYFKKINPELMDNDFLDFKIWRYRNAQPICTPGFLKKLPPIDLPIKGLFVADTTYYYPEDRGTSESIGLGRRIARSV